MFAESQLSANVSLVQNNTLNKIPKDKIRIDSKYCIITIDVPEQVYYSYLPLSKGKYKVKAKDIKKAELMDGKYVIDYSTCNPLKSYCIGIGTKDSGYQVDGFSWEYRDKEVYSVSAKSGKEVKKTWNGNKYYTCLGSDFDYLYHVNAYYAPEINKISSVKWDINHEKGSGSRLIHSARIAEYYYDTYYNRSKKINKSTYVMGLGKKPKRSWNYPFKKEEDGHLHACAKFPYDFIWREKGNQKWLQASELTHDVLKGYLEEGTNLEFRFDVVNDFHSNYTGEMSEAYIREAYEPISGDRYGVPVKIVIKKVMVPRAPKVKLDVAKETVSLKNGMQYSWDKEHWMSILPYASPVNFGLSSGVYYGSTCQKCNDDYVDPYSGVGYMCQKVNSMSLVELGNYSCVHTLLDIEEALLVSDKTLYVRSMAKANGLPSEIAEVRIPRRYFGPIGCIEKMAKGYQVKNIQNYKRGSSLYGDEYPDDPVVGAGFEYSYRITAYGDGGYSYLMPIMEAKMREKYGSKYGGAQGITYTVPWVKCKEGTVLKQKLVAKVQSEIFVDGYNKVKKVSINVPLELTMDDISVVFHRKSVSSKNIMDMQLDSGWSTVNISEGKLQMLAHGFHDYIG